MIKCRLRAVILLVLFVFMFTACKATADRETVVNPLPTVVAEASPGEAAIKNVIVFIGDGMGNSQRRIAAIVEGNGDPEHRLAMEQFTTSGVAFNHSLDEISPDSSSSGTALSTGHKTNDGMVAMTPDGKKVKTILELCGEMGKSTGLITTVTIPHATPACYGAHVKERDMYEEIAAQYLKAGIDVLMGGGGQHFIPKDSREGFESLNIPENWKANRDDWRNLVKEFLDSGYTVVFDRSGLMETDKDKTGKLLGIFAGDAMAYEIDRDPEKEPSIAEMTKTAIDILSKNPKGFFLMVEGGKIDWANHGNDVAGSVYDTIALDEAVRIGLEFAGDNPDTLIIVVNDHETGGMALTWSTNPEAISKIKATSVKMASLIAAGKDIDKVFGEYAGIKDLTEQERQMVIDEMEGRLDTRKVFGYGGTVIAHILSKRTGILFATGGHTGTPVIVAAYGPGCRIFDGFYDQAEIPKKIAELLGEELK